MKNELERLDPSFAVVSTDEAREILGGTSTDAVEVTGQGREPVEKKDNHGWIIKPTNWRWP